MERLTADNAAIKPCIGFVPDVDGQVSVRGRGDAANVLLDVLGGVEYSGDIKQWSKTLSTTVAAVTILRQNATI